MDEDLTTHGPLHRQLGTLQARLLQAFPSPRFTHDLVPAVLTGTVWAEMVGRAPFVGICWAGIAPSRDAGRVYDGTCNWRVFLVAKNTRDVERFIGGGRDIGLLGMTQTAMIFLHGFTPPPPPGRPQDAEGTMRVGAVDNAFGSDWQVMTGACATLEVSTPLRLHHDYRAEDFLTLAATWPSEDASDDPTIRDTHNVRQPL